MSDADVVFAVIPHCLLLQCFVAAQPRMSEDVPAAAPVAVSVMAA